ncbi:WLM-domain-containing protein [Polychaeton citri CBS 116435]|uniref:WLM-domain-containing protein n=1 Tax=Polychaeton citri CBS 116435 TaxID=1314669 RepID=A0A9P4QE65_9PEZI|nr:WLM-domain-containing protein [Polychaeton citri CBS 116435]
MPSRRSKPSSQREGSGVQRSYASQLKEHDSLFNTYEHLPSLPRADDALKLLRKIASLVKPIMRKRGWKVQILAEFLPSEQNLLGLNINKGYKICLRLRYHNHPDLFLPLEQVVDTALHELSHNVWGDHDGNFHRLWDELRDEHEILVRKGYTGEGFLSEGHRLGGSRMGRPVPQQELRQLARQSAEKRKQQGALTVGSGQRLGGTPLHLMGSDVRNVIADQVDRRNTINRGCASGRSDAGDLSQQQENRVFSTKAEEDDANDRAIAQAIYELMEEEEERTLQKRFEAKPTGGGLAWSREAGLFDPSSEHSSSSKSTITQSEEEQMKWAMEQSVDDHASGAELAISAAGAGGKVGPHAPFQQDPDQWTCEVCTLVNPLQFLACDACGVERPQKSALNPSSRSTRPSSSRARSTASSLAAVVPPPQKSSLGWNCMGCGTFMEHQWWTCSACGRMKELS